MPIAPGRLTVLAEDQQMVGFVAKDLDHLQIKNTSMAGINPACNKARQKIIFVLPGPGRP
jgi:hypothetical protein